MIALLRSLEEGIAWFGALDFPHFLARRARAK